MTKELVVENTANDNNIWWDFTGITLWNLVIITQVNRYKHVPRPVLAVSKRCKCSIVIENMMEALAETTMNRLLQVYHDDFIIEKNFERSCG